MDHLMDTLRMLAKQPQSTNCVDLAEREIEKYLQTAPDLLDRLMDAIDMEAEPFQGTNGFWIVVQNFVRFGR